MFLVGINTDKWPTSRPDKNIFFIYLKIIIIYNNILPYRCRHRCSDMGLERRDLRVHIWWINNKQLIPFLLNYRYDLRWLVKLRHGGPMETGHTMSPVLSLISVKLRHLWSTSCVRFVSVYLRGKWDKGGDTFTLKDSASARRKLNLVDHEFLDRSYTV